MQEDDLRASENIDDRRGSGGGGMGIRTGGLGIGTIAILGLIGWALGINPATLIGGAEQLSQGGSVAPQQQAGQVGTPTDQMGNFVARVLGETEDVWTQTLPQQANRPYEKPVLVLYSGVTSSGCGTAQQAMGPFYCPLDHKLYLDTSFFDDMRAKYGGGGDFAYAYVIAHEVGHHVQNLLGILPKAEQAEQQAASRAGSNAVSVRVELMADCLAGVWANKMNARHNNINDDDVRQAVASAGAIGDDRLQRQAQGRVVPDSFTHGTSEQRVRWLTTGLRSGDLRACNTLQASPL